MSAPGVDINGQPGDDLLQRFRRQCVGARHDEEVRVRPCVAGGASRSDISSGDTSCLLGRWPQRLAAAWSSRCMPATSVLMNDRTIRRIFSHEPKAGVGVD